MDAVQKQCLVGMTLDEITGATKDLSLPSYLPREIAIWVYKRGAVSIDHFTNISKKHRQELNERFEVGLSPYVKVSTSTDGTRKYLYKALANRYIESAYIPDIKRHTLCISSQVGCKLGCLFCMTGKQGFQGHLTSNQILNQILSLPERRLLTNLVFMGMGEPLANLEQVLKSLTIITSDHGLNFSTRRITLSTVGLIPEMLKLSSLFPIKLAVSLHAADNETRSRIMPINRRYPLEELLNACRSLELPRRNRITFEYLLLGGVNDSPEAARKLAKLLRGLRAKINIILFNEYPGAKFKAPSPSNVEEFQKILQEKHFTATVRQSHGAGIMAACGQLSHSH